MPQTGTIDELGSYDYYGVVTVPKVHYRHHQAGGRVYAGVTAEKTVEVFVSAADGDFGAVVIAGSGPGQGQVSLTLQLTAGSVPVTFQGRSMGFVSAGGFFYAGGLSGPIPGTVTAIVSGLGSSTYSGGGGGELDLSEVVEKLEQIRLEVAAQLDILDGTNAQSPFFRNTVGLATIVYESIAKGDGPEGKTLFQLVKEAVGEAAEDPEVGSVYNDVQAQAEVSLEANQPDWLDVMPFVEGNNGALSPAAESSVGTSITFGGYVDAGPGLAPLEIHIDPDFASMAGATSAVGIVMLLGSTIIGITLVLAELRRR